MKRHGGLHPSSIYSTSNLLESFDFIALAAELLRKDAAGEEFVDFLGAKVPSNFLKLIERDFDWDLLCDLNAAFSLLEHGLVRHLLVEHVEQELVDVALLILVLLEFLGKLARDSHFLTLEEAL